MLSIHVLTYSKIYVFTSLIEFALRFRSSAITIIRSFQGYRCVCVCVHSSSKLGRYSTSISHEIGKDRHRGRSQASSRPRFGLSRQRPFSLSSDRAPALDHRWSLRSIARNAGRKANVQNFTSIRSNNDRLRCMRAFPRKFVRREKKSGRIRQSANRLVSYR